MLVATALDLPTGSSRRCCAGTSATRTSPRRTSPRCATPSPGPARSAGRDAHRRAHRPGPARPRTRAELAPAAARRAGAAGPRRHRAERLTAVPRTRHRSHRPRRRGGGRARRPVRALHLAGAGRAGHGPRARAGARRAGRAARGRRLPVRHRPDRADHARPHRRRPRCRGRGLDDWLDLGRSRPGLPRLLPGRLDARRAHRRRRAWPTRSSGCAGRPRPPATGATSTSSPSCTATRCPTSSTATSTPRSACSPRTSRGSSRSAPSVGSHPKVGSYLKDPRTQRLFSFQAMYAGLAAARRARDLRRHRLHGLGRRGVLPARRDARSAAGDGRRRPRSTASRSGTARPSPRSSAPAPAPCAVHTADGERVACRRRRAQPRPAGGLPRPARERALARAAADVLPVLLPAAARLDRDVLPAPPTTTSTSAGRGDACSAS